MVVRLRGQHLLSADLTLLKKMERESLLESLDWLVIHAFWRARTSLSGGGGGGGIEFP